MSAPYEARLMQRSRGKTIHVDATYKVINPSRESADDFRSAPQFVSFTMHAEQISKRVFLRGFFTKPTTREKYSQIFDSFFALYGLPSGNSYAGFSGDFSTTQLEGYILSYIRFDRKRKNLKELPDEVILKDSKLVSQAASYFRGCGFHYSKALIEIKRIIEDPKIYSKIFKLLTELQSVLIPAKYEEFQNSLSQLAALTDHRFRNWLKWWRNDFHGIRFKVVHARYLSQAQKRIESTNNPQEGLHKVIKHDYGVIRTGDFLKAGIKFQAYLNEHLRILDLANLGYPSHYGDLPKARPKTKRPQKAAKRDRPESNYDLIYCQSKKDPQTRRVPSLAQSIEDRRVISSFCSWDWRNNSCSIDAALSALMIPFYMSSTVSSTKSPLAVFYAAFKDRLQSDGTPKASTLRLINDAFARLLRAMNWDKLSSLWGDAADRVKSLTAECWPKEEILDVFVLPDSDVSRHINLGDTLSIVVEMMWEMEDLETPPMQIHVHSAITEFASRKRRFPIHFVSSNHDLYSLQSVILHHEGVHFRTLMFVSNQSDANHLLDCNTELAPSTFLKNGVYLHDPYEQTAKKQRNESNYSISELK